MLSDTLHITKYLYSTIFKTYNNDLDGILNKIGFSKRSFAEWGSQVAKSFTEAEGKINKVTNALKTMISVQTENSDDWLKNSFGDIVTNDNINSYIPKLTESRTNELIEEINAVHMTNGSWNEYYKTLKSGEDWVIDLIKNTEDLSKLTGDDLVKANQQARATAIAHNEALKQQTLGAKAASVAMKALSVAGNMLVSYLVTKGIQLAYEAWDNYIHKVEIAKAKLDDSKSEFNEVFLELQNVNEELKKNSDRIDELNAKDKLTYVEQSELEKLQAVTKELERQKNIQNKETEDAATKLSKDNQIAFELEYGDNSFSSADVMELANGISPSATLAVGGLEELAAAYLRVKQAQDDVYQPHDEDWIGDLDSAAEMEAELESQLIGHLTTLQEYKDNLVSITDFRDLTDGEQVFLANIENGIKMIYELTDPAAWNNIEVNAIFNTEGIEKTKSELVAMAKEGTLTSEMIEGYTNLNKVLEDSELILQDGQTAAEALMNEMYALAEAEKALEDSKPDEVVPFEAKSMQDTVSQLNSMADKWQKVNDLYAEFKDNGTGDFSTESLASVSEAFSDVDGVNIERFLSVLADSSSTADEVQSAFNQLANEYIYASGCLEGLTDATAEQVIKELEAQGVANASAVIHQYLAAQKEYVARTGEDLANATTAEIVAFLDEANASDVTKQALAQLELAKLAVNGAQINTASDIEQVIALANAAGASAEAMYQLAAVQAAVGGAALIDPTSAEYDPFAAKEAQRSLANLKSGQFDFKYEKLDAGEFQSATYTGNKSTGNSSSGSGNSGSDKTKEIKEEFDWLQRLDDYYQKQHDLQSKIAEDESASYSERIAALKEMTNLDKQRMGSATQTASEYLNKWEEIKKQLDPKYIAKIMYGNISKEELKAEENTALADQIELIKQGIEYYDMWQEAEQKKLELQEDCTERLKEEVALEQELIQAQRELLQGEIDYAQAHIDYLEASGGVVTEGYYKEQIRLSKEISDTYEDEIENLREQQALVKDGSAEYYQLEADIADCESAIIACKTEQAEWNEAIKRLPVERMQKYINMLKAIKQELEDFLDYQETIGQATTKDQFQQLIDINQEQINKLQEQAIELQGLLGDYKYGSDKFNEVAEELSDIQNETANLVNQMQEYNNEILNIPIEKLQSVNEELERYSSILSGIMDDYNSTLNAVNHVIEEQIQGYEDLKTAADDTLESQVEPLQETLDLLEKTNTAREKEIALEQAKYNLEHARNQKTIAVVRDGKIEYESDIDAVRDAEQELQNAELDKIKYDIQTQIEQFEEHHDNLIKGYDEEIDRLTDISNKWKEIQENASKYADTLKADATLGSNWQDKILSGNDDDIYQMFKNLYESTNQQQVHVDEQIASNERIAEMMQVFVDRFIDGSVTYEQALSGISELSSSINQGYTSLEQLNGLMNLDGLSGMAEITTSMQGQINESVSMLAQYIDVAKVNNDAIAEYTSTWEEMSELIKEQLAALKKAAEELEEWVKNQKYHGYSSDSGDGGGSYGGKGVTSNGVYDAETHSYSNPGHSNVSSEAPSSANDDQDEDDGPGVYHEGGFVGKGNDNRKKIIKEIATKDLKPNERYVKVEVGEGIFTIPQQDKLIKNFQNAYTPHFIPVTQSQTLPNNVSRQGDINVEFNGDLNLPDVRDVDGFARALTAQFPNIMRQELSKWN